MASSQTSSSPPGVPPQYYASYQSAYPYYATGYPMYNMMNANPLAAQGYPNAAAPSTVLPNQTGTVPLPANQNAGELSYSTVLYSAFPSCVACPRVCRIDCVGHYIFCDMLYNAPL